jgi:hypothetical protein
MRSKVARLATLAVMSIFAVVATAEAEVLPIPLPDVPPPPDESLPPVIPPAPPPDAPRASFTFTPASPETGQVVTFDGTSSFCPVAPCTFEWYDTTPSVPWGTGPVIQKTFQYAGTKQATLRVTDRLGRESVVAKPVTVTQAGSPPPPPGSGPAPPALINPQTVTITDSAKTLNLDPNRDYVIQQAGTLTGNVRVYGGRNVIWRGMRVIVPPQQNASTTAFRYARRGPQFDGFTGHLFIEDYRITGDLAEGIVANVPSGFAGGRVTLFNGRCELLTRAYTRMVNGVPASRAPTWGTSYSPGASTYDGMKAYESGKWWDEHNDCFQSWSMPQAVHIERVTGVTPCQFDYLEPDGGNRTLTLKDVNARQYTAPWDGSKVSGRFFWGSGWTVTLDNVWGDNSDAGFSGVKQGVPPGGDFVP